MARVRGWLDRLKPLASRTDPLGVLARRELPQVTGLSAQNVAWALENAFECHASDDEIRTLVEATVPCSRAHVVLSANVFVAALRAIAIALASSSRVRVRASRREPLTARLLQMAAPGSFELVTSLDVRSGEHLWAYGSDASLTEIERSLAPGAVLHAHGDGFGVFVIDASTTMSASDLDAMALDIAAFDQQGCLSPRFVLFEGSNANAIEFAEHLLEAMNRIERALPIGNVDTSGLAARARYRETWRYLGTVFENSGGLVSVDLERYVWGVAPGCYRAIHVRTVEEVGVELTTHARFITNVGRKPDRRLSALLETTVPLARQSAFGTMQRPPLDGPADRRADPAGRVVTRP